MKNQNTKTSIVLVHGAFADGSSWNKVIPLLEAEGFTVTAVQNPLKSLSEDVATTKRVLDAQKGDVVLVGHSYGGAGLTQACARDSKRKKLGYIGAVPPASGGNLFALCQKIPAAPPRTALVPGSWRLSLH